MFTRILVIVTFSRFKLSFQFQDRLALFFDFSMELRYFDAERGFTLVPNIRIVDFFLPFLDK